MPLLAIWKNNPEEVAVLTIEQIVSMAGDGVLRDGSECSSELRAYLAQVSSEKLASYVDRCLTAHFEKSGFVLQDLVNELARRLDYNVTNGRYQGTTTAVGFDGIWESPETHTLITEVKTTDAYRISLDTVVGYRSKLVTRDTVTEPASILLVVGRQDTGELEAQVRGSRHAWDVRLISAEALVKLVMLKEDSDDVETGKKIRSILAPVEYTRLDYLVDVMFTAARDVEQSIEDGLEDKDEPKRENHTAGNSGWEFTDPKLLQQKRDSIIASMSKQLGAPLIKKSRAQYWNSDHDKRIVCTISKKYSRQAAAWYWYAYHPQWDTFLSDASHGYLVLGCMDLDVAFAIPRSAAVPLLQKLNTTETSKGMYWHIHVTEAKAGVYELVIPRSQENFSLTPFTLKL